MYNSNAIGYVTSKFIGQCQSKIYVLPCLKVRQINSIYDSKTDDLRRQRFKYNTVIP